MFNKILLLIFVAFLSSAYSLGKSIPGEYIVVFEQDVNVQYFALGNKSRILEIFESINGALVETDDPSELYTRQGIAYVEANREVSIFSGEQQNPEWGLDRIDARKGLDKTYKYGATGKGVHAYVVDTGIYPKHDDYADRIGEGYTVISDDTGDCHGHGTHVAGTIGGKKYGVAKDVMLYPVRVLDCRGNGSMSGIISGVEWIIANAKLPAVVNMSLGGNKMQSLNDAITNGTKKGILFVVAAGNSATNACNTSPASAIDAVTVAASDDSDKSARFTSHGSCVSVYAPGVNITSTWISSPTSTNMLSGTSMATPHVAGAAALFYELNPFATPIDIKTKIIQSATKKAISGVPVNTPNKLLYVGIDDDDSDNGDDDKDKPINPPQPPQPPPKNDEFCQKEQQIKSPRSLLRSRLGINNHRVANIDIYWLNFNGERQYLSSIASARTASYNGALGHYFVAVDNATKKCIGMYKLGSILGHIWDIR